ASTTPTTVTPSPTPCSGFWDCIHRGFHGFGVALRDNLQYGGRLGLGIANPTLSPDLDWGKRPFDASGERLHGQFSGFAERVAELGRNISTTLRAGWKRTMLRAGAGFMKAAGVDFGSEVARQAAASMARRRRSLIASAPSVAPQPSTSFPLFTVCVLGFVALLLGVATGMGCRLRLLALLLLCSCAVPAES
nr:putative Y protein [Rodent pegivirus]